MPHSQAPISLRVENHPVRPVVLGIGVGSPRLSWVVPAADQGWAQTAYEIEIARAGSVHTFEVPSAESVLVPWPDAPLASRESAAIRLRVRDDAWSGWSEPVVVEAGLLAGEDWSARFVSPVGIGGLDSPAPVLRGTWRIPADVVSARIYVTAHGVYELSLNGTKVGDELLAPGWTSYHHRLRYQTHDVTALLREGDNDVAALLGNGWWRGHLTWSMRQAVYGDRLALLAQLEVVTADGARHVLTADETFHAAEGAVRSDDLYNGQITDLRIAEPVGSAPVEVVDADLSVLVTPDGPPVRAVQTLAAQRVWRSPTGKLLVDFGQNLVGWCRLTVRGLPAGHEVTVKHAEVLEHDELGTRPLRNARATDTWLLAGTDEAVLEPSLTFHGFRYAEVHGVDELEPEDITAVVVSSDLDRTGWFESSHELLDRFHENVVWGMRGNFLDVPTDCPQRDERLGWTGDIQVFSPTAQFLMDSTGFLASWLKDLAADQNPDGAVPFVIPDVLNDGMAAAAWGDAATVVPWVLWQRSQDVEVLRRQLPSMRAWVERMDAASPEGLWAGGFQFGDWLDPTAPPHDPLRSKADKDVIATAHLVRSAQITAEAAALVGDVKTAVWARHIEERSLSAFRREYVTAGGRVLSDAPTVYALALVWDLLDAGEQRRRAAARLADLVRSSAFRIATGFVGTPLIADALADNGFADLAYRLLLQTECPSWLYSVTMGATTVWERYDSMLPDGTINPGEMTSFNHYALGGVADWLHRRVAGLAPAAPGYRRLRIAPLPGGGLTRASARHLTPYGEASAGWEIADGSLHVRAVVPVGCSAEVVLPGGDVVEAGHGTHEWAVPWTEPETRRPTTVRELLDHEPSWKRFVGAALGAELGGMSKVSGEQDLADRLAPFLGAPIAAVPDILTLGGNDPGRERFVELLGDLVED
jgi:alpha-L-rhamnosidase